MGLIASGYDSWSDDRDTCNNDGSRVHGCRGRASPGPGDVL